MHAKTKTKTAVSAGNERRVLGRFAEKKIFARRGKERSNQIGWTHAACLQWMQRNGRVSCVGGE